MTDLAWPQHLIGRVLVAWLAQLDWRDVAAVGWQP
jgi:hypothetical protein